MQLLVVVDMQNDFIDGALGTPEAQEIVERVAAMVRDYDDMGEPILYTRDTHYEEFYMESQEGRNLPVPHCIHGTKGWEIHKDVYVPNQYYINKLTFGYAGIGNAVNDIMADRDEAIDSIIIVGLCTDICVISNAMILKSFFPEMLITVDSACCAGVTPESHYNALKAMRACQIKVV